MTQNSQILSYLQTRGAITALEALSHFGCFRLAARIKDLREEGHLIHTTMIRNEKGARYARYTLHGDNNNGQA